MDPTRPALTWVPRLRSAGLRVTQPRLAVLNVLETQSHLVADQVAERVRTDIGTVSTQAIYDALNTLTEHGILRRFEPAGSSMRFETNLGDNHHHLVCRKCGAVADVACGEEVIPCAVPIDTQGFRVDEAEVTYWGLCAACAAPEPERPATTSEVMTPNLMADPTPTEVM